MVIKKKSHSRSYSIDDFLHPPICNQLFLPIRASLSLENLTFINPFLTACFLQYVLGSTAGRFYIPPHFIHEPSDTVVRRNEAVALNCDVGGSSVPNEIVWEKDGKPIDTKEDLRRKIAPNGTLLFDKILHIKDAKPYVGEYQCFASSRAGRIASRKVHLDVAGKTRSDICY